MDPSGRVHHLDHVVVADWSTFPTAGSHIPTLTGMALAFHNASFWA
jgi:choline dehydrogenase-like flavoprotein